MWSQSDPSGDETLKYRYFYAEDAALSPPTQMYECVCVRMYACADLCACIHVLIYLFMSCNTQVSALGTICWKLLPGRWFPKILNFYQMNGECFIVNESTCSVFTIMLRKSLCGFDRSTPKYLFHLPKELAHFSLREKNLNTKDNTYLEKSSRSKFSSVNETTHYAL